MFGRSSIPEPVDEQEVEELLAQLGEALAVSDLLPRLSKLRQ